MKKIFAFISLIIFAASCEKIQPDGTGIKQIKAIITDLKGAPVAEAASGFMLRLTAPEFIEFNKQGILIKDGFIAFDKGFVKIKEADGDYIITEVPILDYIDPIQLRNITLYIRQNPVLDLCNECIIYDPTVRGTIFSGFRGGVTDGTFLKPAEMINDIAGNIYTIDQRFSDHDLILKTTPTGVTTVFAGTGDLFGRLVGIGIDESRGLLYVSDATSQQVKSISIATPSVVTVLAGSGIAGNTDGTGTVASFRFGSQRVDDFGRSENGQGLAVDASGNIFVGENFTGSLGSQIRRVLPTGVTNTVTGTRVIAITSEDESAMPSGIALNSANEIVTTSGSSGLFQGINKFTTLGVFSRFAGRESFEGLRDGLGNMAQFSYPKAIRSFRDHFFIADGTNGALRKVSTSGSVITLAGVGHSHTNRFSGGAYLPPLEGIYRITRSFLGTDIHEYETAARAIRMDQVGGVAVINDGLIYVSDYGYNCIWKITIR